MASPPGGGLVRVLGTRPVDAVSYLGNQARRDATMTIGDVPEAEEQSTAPVGPARLPYVAPFLVHLDMEGGTRGKPFSPFEGTSTNITVGPS